MKLLIIVSVSLLLFSCNNNPSIETSTISNAEKEIAKNLIQGAFDDLWGGVDSTKILKYHTEDFYILEQGEVWDNNRIKKYMRGQLANPDRPKRVNEMEYLTIDKFGSAINIAYNNKASFYQNDSLLGQVQWLESALAVSTENGWKLRSMHSTYVPEKK